MEDIIAFAMKGFYNGVGVGGAHSVCSHARKRNGTRSGIYERFFRSFNHGGAVFLFIF